METTNTIYRPIPIETNFAQTQTSNPPSSVNSQVDGVYTPELISIPGGLLLMGLTLSLLLGFKLKKALLDRVFVTLKHLDDPPCFNCKYYHNNPHLKCAIQPSKVLKREATNCSDYIAK